MSRQGRRATIIDVAARAGVSRQTVSRALNDMAGISAETRERVLEAAKELNYRPSRFGRGLVEQGPTTLGLVVGSLTNSYYAELGAAVVRACVPHGWNVVLAEADDAPQPERVAADLSRRVDALVGYGVLTAGIRGGGMPIVQVDGSAAQLGEAGVVELPREQAMADLAAHLRDRGVRRPVVLDLGTPETRERTDALVGALGGIAEEGRVPVRTVHAREGHEEALPALLADGADALIAFNDELAVRMLRALRRSGIDVPSRVRVTGVDGLEISTLVTPELTTLALDIERVAEATVALVAGMLEGTVPLSGEGAHRRVDYRLVVRDST
jgi:DNA-binding LacI/PurR family transcriptional regulator